jgi:hypothetical protein
MQYYLEVPTLWETVGGQCGGVTRYRYSDMVLLAGGLIRKVAHKDNGWLNEEAPLNMQHAYW